jgi:hypothetical protein
MAEPQTSPEFNPLGKLISVLVLLAAALYFTGWIYRWTYFSFFQLEVTTLNLPTESFYLAAFQTFFGEPFAILRTILVLGVTTLAILATLHYLRRLPFTFNAAQKKIVDFLTSLLNELIIVLFVLTALFWLARWQAQADAWKDAVNDTSSLPVVTIVMPKDAAWGRKLDNPLENPANFRIIGDRKAYNRLLGEELTDISNPNKPRVWRLLLKGDGYSYLFPALPKKDPKLTIPVAIVYERDNGVQLTILNSSPSPP